MGKFTTLALAILVICAPLIFSTNLFADQDAIIIGVESNDYYPHYEDKDGELRGYFHDFIAAYGEDTGQKIILKSLPLNRLLVELKKGTIHFKYPDNPKWNAANKKKTFFHSEPIVSYIDGTLVIKSNGERKEIRTLGTLFGFTPWPYYELMQTGTVNVIEGRTLEGILKRLIQGGNDGVYANIDVAYYLMAHKMANMHNIIFDPTLPHAASYYSLSTVHRPDLLADFEAWHKTAQNLKLKLEKKYGVGSFGIIGQMPEISIN